jgi:hypothetical protein
MPDHFERTGSEALGQAKPRGAERESPAGALPKPGCTAIGQERREPVGGAGQKLPVTRDEARIKPDAGDVDLVATTRKFVGLLLGAGCSAEMSADQDEDSHVPGAGG